MAQILAAGGACRPRRLRAQSFAPRLYGEAGIPAGLLNLGVSFALGLWLALRAGNLDVKRRRERAEALWTEVRNHPAHSLWRRGPEHANL